MKKQAFFGIALLALAAGAHAQTAAYSSYARVVSVTPVMSQVRVDVPGDCAPTRGATGSGAIVGAVVGGIVGNRFGGGSGRAAATAAGVMGGAILGDRLEGGRDSHCAGGRSYYEERPDGYEVVYEYGGVQGRVRTTEFPGHDIPVDVRVTPRIR